MNEIKILQQLTGMIVIGGTALGGLFSFILWRLKRDFSRMLNHVDNTDIHLSDRYLKLNETRENERYAYLTERLDANGKNIDRLRDDICKVHQRIDELKACVLKAVQDKN